MSDPNTPDATPTESLELADQQPLGTQPAAAAPAESAAKGGGHTRTILEVVGVAVAGVLIVGAGAVGFAAGHATGDHDDRWSMNRGGSGQQGPDAGGPFGQQGQGGPMRPGQQGQDPRGIDPDGDNWTGGGHRDGGMGDDQMMPGFGEQGEDPRGVDPDGDNWTGGGQMMPQQQSPLAPAAPQSPAAPSTQG